ncbi:alpha-L-arabinofuranosidase C-terminal domain-containing protein [Paraflavitalea pollutisoli]|uniref:alpha-L-arabinofuranosidase C-terminal domain-containing protein n=1 Tax=Paraflavitalea pollutisoli TaxID=3034143 RepID=UPI0023EDE989|nr:alpha-L-arabinofuranosidase C-terminal domain-containing protein [Paraflavitalea sp. H1-2-19X]
MRTFATLLAAGCLSASQLLAQTTPVFTVNASQINTPIQQTMWGIFFEDINFGADGGIYAELVKNRSFEFAAPLMGWKEQKPKNDPSNILIINRGDQSNNPRYARITVRTPNGYGLTNEGFRGMGIKGNEQYDFSILARVVEGNVKLRVDLVDGTNGAIGRTSVPLDGNTWKKYTGTFTASATEAKAKMNVWFEGTGIIEVDMISLFPQKTWKNRPGGLRPDLVQLLADMKPGFLRFPGGCIVEGRELDTRYQWKKTVGPVEDRELIVNRWNTEFRHKLTPDYYQSFGLGFYEYFLLSEDIGASPLPIINCGMACQFNSSEVAPLDALDEYVQDALDLIEFANGSTDSKWGKLRAQMGHPAPFNLKLLGIGNEQWGEQYVDRYKVFAKAIKAKYPEVRLISALGPNPDGELFDYLNPIFRSLKADILDEHYYRAPEWFLKQANRYDNYDRNGPKIFAGEYAAQSKAVASADNSNNWQCAMSEAAFMTGLERNADVVHMASYAPLFAHAEGWQWTPDLIWFNNLQSYGTPNYYVQKMYGTNKGTHVVSMTLNKETVAGQQGLYGNAVIDSVSKEVIIKIVNTSDKAVTSEVALEGVKKLAPAATAEVLKNDNLQLANSFAQPAALSPSQETIKLKGKKLPVTLAPYSFQVFRVKML